MRKKLLVFGLAALVVLAVLLPTIYSITARNTSTRGGRVFKYTAIMSVQKDPPDDPWGSEASSMLLAHQDSISGPTYSFSFSPSTTSSITTTLSLHPTYPMLSTIRIITSFSFSSSTTATVSLVKGSNPLMYIPSRTYSPGVTYRWVITFSMYDTPTLKVMPFAIPSSAGPTTSVWMYEHAPLTALCTYVAPSQGSGTLSLTTSRERVNFTHIRVTYSISIPSGWDGRTISECTVYTTHSSILNNINSRLGTSLTQLWILYLAPNVTVYAGDMIVVEVYAVAPANV